MLKEAGITISTTRVPKSVDEVIEAFIALDKATTLAGVRRVVRQFFFFFYVFMKCLRSSSPER